MFYENSLCLSCNRGTGFEPVAHTMLSLEAGENGTWQREGKTWKFCSNLNACGCNWLLPAESADTLCPACVTTRTLPPLAKPENPGRWQSLETAKRRLLYSLLDFKLWGPGCRLKPTFPLVFDFLDPAEGQKVTTGHQDGVITINVAEADDDERERMRVSLHEPYRTLLGHLRHEVGHYYWDVLIKDGPFLQEFRSFFGDETADYNAAMQRHYNEGPQPNWQENFVSAYATMHPWEDWAETWAHCIHMRDTLDTAMNSELSTALAGSEYEPDVFWGIAESTKEQAAEFSQRLKRWSAAVIQANELARSMGQPDVYPFALTLPVLKKIFFVERVIERSTGEPTAAPAPVTEKAKPARRWFWQRQAAGKPVKAAS